MKTFYGIMPMGSDEAGLHLCAYFFGYNWALEVTPLEWGLCIGALGGSLRLRAGPVDLAFTRRADQPASPIRKVEIPQHVKDALAAMLTEAAQRGEITDSDGKPITSKPTIIGREIDG